MLKYSTAYSPRIIAPDDRVLGDGQGVDRWDGWTQGTQTT